jgi:hypothetical protein
MVKWLINSDSPVWVISRYFYYISSTCGWGDEEDEEDFQEEQRQ